MKYVTIKDSDFYNNGTGLVPNALSSEKFAPPEFNTIIHNRIFLNNFNYFYGKIPFLVQNASTGGVPYPIGVGVLLFGSQNTTIEDNEVFGNYGLGIGALEQLLLSIDDSPLDKADPNGPKIKDQKEWYTLRKNKIINIKLGNDGKNPNGRGIFFDGYGTDNCISGNTGVESTVPADASTFQPCPFTGDNTPNDAAKHSAGPGISRTDHVATESSWIRAAGARRRGHPLSTERSPVGHGRSKDMNHRGRPMAALFRGRTAARPMASAPADVTRWTQVDVKISVEWPGCWG